MSVPNRTKVLSILVLLTLMAAESVQCQSGPIQVYILAGQSNMVGQGRNDHLRLLAESDDWKDEFGHLRRGDDWAVRKDVWVSFERADGKRKIGDLTVGFGKRDDYVGAELGFGTRLGDSIEQPVLLIKCCYGGASLRGDFLPPGAGGPGPMYIRMVNEVRTVLSQAKALFPRYRGQKFQMAGFVWFQGWNDMIAGNPNYTEQLAQLIRDVRKEFSAPELPVVIGELGQSGTEAEEDHLLFRAQQKAVSDKSEFAGSVRFVKTSTLIPARLPEMFAIRESCKAKEAALPSGASDAEKKAVWDEWEPHKQEWSDRAADAPFHYYGSGEVFYLIGEAFAQAILELRETLKPTAPMAFGPRKKSKKSKVDKREPSDRVIDYIGMRKEIQPKVDAAIDSGLDWLIARQLRDGSWGSRQNAYPTGQTALSVYTLLKCGLGPQDKVVKRGLDFILRNDIKRTYTIGCALMALEAAGGKRYRKEIKTLHQRLVALQRDDGGWSYDDAENGHTDLSNTQYAALGLRAARMAGLKTPPKTLRALAEYTMRCQHSPSEVQLPASVAELEKYGPPKSHLAGFAYREVLYRKKPGKASGSMTCAGISVLAIVRDLYGKKAPTALRRRIQRSVGYAENYLRFHWSVKRNPQGGAWKHYYLYGLERVGALLRQEILAGHPWFVEGAEHLVAEQKEEGHWGNAEDATCFSLLFLRRATWNKGGVSARPSVAGTHESAKGAVHLMGSGNARLSLWIRGFSSGTKERFKATPEKSHLRIMKVEYLVDGEVVAAKEGDSTHDWRDESYAHLHAFRRNGSYKISARVHVLPPDQPTVDADTELELLESEPFTLHVQKVKDPHVDGISEAIGQNLLKDAINRFEATSTRKSNGKAEFIADGKEGTSWVSAAVDKRPQINVEITRGVFARTLYISPSTDKVAKGEIESIEVKFNGNRRAYTAEPAFGRGAVKIDLGKRTDIKSVLIKVIKKSPDQEVGIAELYFQR